MRGQGNRIQHEIGQDNPEGTAKKRNVEMQSSQRSFGRNQGRGATPSQFGRPPKIENRLNSSVAKASSSIIQRSDLFSGSDCFAGEAAGPRRR